MIRTVKKWKTPIEKMSESQLVQVLLWLSEEQDFCISLGRKNLMTGTIVWIFGLKATVDVIHTQIDEPGELSTDNTNLCFFTEYQDMIDEFWARMKELAQEAHMTQSRYFGKLRAQVGKIIEERE